MDIVDVKDILNFAVYIETDGHAFYSRMEKKFEAQPDIAKLFGFMAGEEENHKEIFRKLKHRFSGPGLNEQYPGEYRQYLEVYMGNHTIGSDEEVKKKIASVTTIEEATNIALQFEKDSIVFYTSLKSMVAPEGHSLIEKVIREEYAHITAIYNYRRSLLKAL